MPRIHAVRERQRLPTAIAEDLARHILRHRLRREVRPPGRGRARARRVIAWFAARLRRRPRARAGKLLELEARVLPPAPAMLPKPLAAPAAASSSPEGRRTVAEMFDEMDDAGAFDEVSEVFARDGEDAGQLAWARLVDSRRRQRLELERHLSTTERSLKEQRRRLEAARRRAIASFTVGAVVAQAALQLL